MDRLPVKSSFIESIGYDPDGRTMHVKLKNGKTYAYEGVDPIRHNELMSAKSIGQHFHAHIKPHFEGKVVDENEPLQKAAGGKED
jgi:hypothetical protein